MVLADRSNQAVWFSRGEASFLALFLLEKEGRLSG